METVTLSEARVYVGTYNKYNSGSLFGKWLDLGKSSVSCPLKPSDSAPLC